jgi:hypothetical protein
MNDETALMDMESIKQLKARYCRYLDTKDWDRWRDLFTDDFVGDTTQVHAPEIELTPATTARGIWALNDVVRLVPALTLHGYGHYHETYEKIGGRWRIKTSRLTRLREDVKMPVFAPRIAARLRAAAAKIALRSAD